MQEQSQAQGTPFYKRTWFSIVVIVVVVLVAVGIIAGYYNNSYGRKQKAELRQSVEQYKDTENKLQKAIDQILDPVNKN